jgi:centromeric protein E
MRQYKVRALRVTVAVNIDETNDFIAAVVAFRLRPLSYNERSHKSVWKVLPNYSAITQTNEDGTALAEKAFGKTLFAFDKTFDESSSTQQVYDSVAKGIVNSVATGVNGTIFAYGQTSSGKTYTMQGSGTIEEGSSGSGGGIVHMAAKDIFNHIHSHHGRSFLVRASFLEIYNEEVRDLLVPVNENRTVSIREDPRRGVFVQSREEIVSDYQSLLSVLFQGEKSRAFAATAMNERSSRSHTIFRITIESREKDGENKENEAGEEEETSQGCDSDATLVSTLNLVDLAGSESVRHTGATGDRQKEGGMINTRYGFD